MPAPNVITLATGVPESASGIIALDAIESPILRQGVDYWRRLKGARTYPTRADLTPRDLSPLLRNIVLLRLVDGGADYEYRIVGDAHVISHGFTMQGLKVSDVDKFSPGYGPVLRSLYDRAVRRREIYAFRGWLERGDKHKQYIYSESVFMPMGPDEATIDHVLNFSVYTPRDSFDG
ncbi:MAG: PAS domain-containing protein [Rhizomicrobium sp.]